MPTVRTIRRFTIDDQRDFARLSGDWNPIHVDPVQARRLLFGEPVVHGVHLVLWALDRLAAATPIAALSRLEARFDSAALVDTEIEMEPPVMTGSEIGIRLRSATRPLARLKFTPGLPGPDWRNPGPPPQERCHELDAAQIAGAAGSVSLGFDREMLTAMLPGLATFAPGQVAWLLAATRVIGTRLPGLHSLFTGLRASFDGSATATRLDYRAAEWDDRFRLVTVALAGAGEGRATALLRPRPVAQPSFARIAARIAPDRFAGASALIVGGSRGLGEAAAKLFAAGGAKVTLTYHRGRAEAEQLVAEIAAGGGQALPLCLDIAAPEQALGSAALAPFTHLVYCAAPRIRKGGATFDPALQARYAEVFVAGLERVLRAAEPHLAPAVTLVVPSTIYVANPEPGFAEYAAAKAAAEAAALEAKERMGASGRRITLIQPRFARLRTDQTAQAGDAADVDLADPADALLAVL